MKNLLWVCLFLLAGQPALALENAVLSGDVRTRVQNDVISGTESHISEKLRIRVDGKWKLNSELKTEIRLATGTSGRSQNQTLGDSKNPGSPRQFFGLDLAYVEWDALENARLYIGRVPQFEAKVGGSQLVLDEDLAIEGAGGEIENKIGESFVLRFAGGSSIIRENYDSYYSEKQLDSSINWAQLSSRWDLSDALSWQLGAGFFNFVGLQGRLFTELSGGGSPAGNSATADGRVQYRYLIRQAFTELRIRNGPMDLKLFGDFVTNPETDTPHDGYWVGFGASMRDVDFNLAYGEIQKDAVVALMSNSDFANGEADSRGWVASLRWNFMKKMNARLSYFANTTRVSSGGAWFSRAMADLSAAF